MLDISGMLGNLILRFQHLNVDDAWPVHHLACSLPTFFNPEMPHMYLLEHFFSQTFGDYDLVAFVDDVFHNCQFCLTVPVFRNVR